MDTTFMTDIEEFEIRGARHFYFLDLEMNEDAARDRAIKLIRKRCPLKTEWLDHSTSAGWDVRVKKNVFDIGMLGSPIYFEYTVHLTFGNQDDEVLYQLRWRGASN